MENCGQGFEEFSLVHSPGDLWSYFLEEYLRFWYSTYVWFVVKLAAPHLLVPKDYTSYNPTSHSNPPNHFYRKRDLHCQLIDNQEWIPTFTPSKCLGARF